MVLKSIALIIGLGLLISPASAKNDRYGDDNYESKKNKDREYRRDRDRDGEYRRDRDDDREYDRKRGQKHKPLNRGMQKKVDRGGQLPPGWKKKLIRGKTLDREVYRHSRVVEPVNIRGEITIEVDDRLIRLHQATMEIIDVFKSTQRKD